jgi:hypothetical protein
MSLDSKDAIAILLGATLPTMSCLSMMEHLPEEEVVSPPSPLPPWVQWSNKLEREMYLKHALAKLKLEYLDSVDSADYHTLDL